MNMSAGPAFTRTGKLFDLYFEGDDLFEAMLDAKTIVIDDACATIGTGSPGYLNG